MWLLCVLFNKKLLFAHQLEVGHMQPNRHREFEANINAVRPDAIVSLSKIFGRKRAEDLFQEACLRAWTKYEQFDSNRPFKPWFVTVAIRRGIELVRKEKNKTRNPPGIVVSTDDCPPHVINDSLDLAIQSENVTFLRSELCALPGSQKLAMKHRLNGATNDEIAELLDITNNAVRGLIFRAKIALQERLTPLIACKPFTEGLNPIGFSELLLKRFDLCRKHNCTTIYEEAFDKFDSSVRATHYFVVLLERRGNDVAFAINIIYFAPEYNQFELPNIEGAPFSENFEKQFYLFDTFNRAQKKLSLSKVDRRVYCGPLNAKLGGEYDSVVIPISIWHSLLVLRRLSPLPEGWTPPILAA